MYYEDAVPGEELEPGHAEDTAPYKDKTHWGISQCAAAPSWWHLEGKKKTKKKEKPECKHWSLVAKSNALSRFLQCELINK